MSVEKPDNFEKISPKAKSKILEKLLKENSNTLKLVKKTQKKA